MIFGASGGIGHIAVQLAKRIGAKVLAVASKPDGVALVRRLGADVAIDGQKGDIAKAIRAFAPDGLDAALVLAGGSRSCCRAEDDDEGRLGWRSRTGSSPNLAHRRAFARADTTAHPPGRRSIASID